MFSEDWKRSGFELLGNTEAINELLDRYGVKFGIYKKNGVFNEQLFPFDPIPRVIPKKDFTYLEQGLIQRVDVLNLFIVKLLIVGGNPSALPRGGADNEIMKKYYYVTNYSDCMV